MPKVVCQNPDCNKEYYAKPSRIKKGYDKFCSGKCSKLIRTKERLKNKKTRWNTICKRVECGKKYYVLPSKKKAGLGIYCSHKCYSLDKKNNPLSEEHKKNIGKATKKMWEDGVFDAPHIREAYSRQGKATKGSKRTKEQKQRMSEQRKGKDVSYLHTPEVRAKALKSRDGYVQSPESNKKRSETLKGRKFSEQHRQRLSDAHKTRSPDTFLRGKDSPFWKDGASQQSYPARFKAVKKEIRERDDERCRLCNFKSSKNIVHHIDANKKNLDLSNLIIICRSCHGKVHASYKTDDPVILAFRSMLNYGEEK